MFDTTLDPSVTGLELEQAGAAPSTDYPTGDVHDNAGDENEDVARGLVAVIPRTPKEGLANLARMRLNHIPIGGVGLCLQDVRTNCWGIPALWPTAKDAGEHGAPIHRFAKFSDAPRGMTLIFENDHVWHITVGLGGGLNNTSDYHEPGYNGVATIQNTYDWCGAHDWYGIETVNLVDCWPTAKPPTPKPWGLAEREREVHRLLAKARKNKAPQHRIDGLVTWDDRMVARLKDHHLDRLPLK